MKKTFSLLLAGALSLSLLAGCGSKGAAQSSAASTSTGGASASTSLEGTTLKVGATPAPHAEILEVVKDILADQGITLEIVSFNDYIQPNTAVESGDLDANYFQHITYMNDFNQANGTHLVDAADVHYEPFGLYAGKTTSLDALADGAQVAVPNDATNEARALLLLQDQGVIKLTDGVGLEATANDIVENPHNVELVEVEAAAVPRSLQDVDFGVINGNYALSAGLDTSATLASEGADSEAAQTYANIIAVRSGDENSEKTQALLKALTSDTARKFIEDTYKGSVIPVF